MFYTRHRTAKGCAPQKTVVLAGPHVAPMLHNVRAAPPSKLGGSTSRATLDELGTVVTEEAEMLRVMQISKEEAAMRNYEVFHQLKKGSVTLEQVQASSTGVDGWAEAVATPQEESEASGWVVIDDEDAAPPAELAPLPPPPSDAVEARELQFALLASVGVNLENLSLTSPGEADEAELELTQSDPVEEA